MNNPKDMLVSNEWLDAEEGADFNAEMEFTGDEKTADLSSTKWRAGAECIRAIYESELTKLRSERDELVGALRVFADIFDGDLDSIGGGTIVRRTAVQPFKDAKAILSKHKPE